MAQIIVTINEKNDHIEIRCEGEISVGHMAYMVLNGFDELKLQFCSDLLKYQSGEVEIDTCETAKEMRNLVNKIIEDSKKDS